MVIRSMLVAGLSLLAFAAQAQDDGQKLARETVDMVNLQEQMLVTAIRQKDSRGGAADFQKFILTPIDKLAARWRDQPKDVQREFIFCVSVLGEHEFHARDSFKAGKVLKPSSLLSESLASCKREIKAPATTRKK